MRAKLTAALLILVVVVGFSSFAYAENALVKLGRGLVNAATGWLEIPQKIYTTSRDENVFVGATVGTAKGIGWSIIRTVAGIYEVVTFPFPIPKSYESVIDPPYIFDSKSEIESESE